MGNLHVLTTFVVLLNVLMWTGGLAMTSINPDGTMCYNIEGSIIEQNVAQGTNSTVLADQISDDLPSSESATVTSGTTNIFVDVFSNVLSWFKSAPGVKYVYGVVSAPYNVLKCMNLPDQFVAGIGTFWYMVSFLVLIAFLWGRD